MYWRSDNHQNIWLQKGCSVHVLNKVLICCVAKQKEQTQTLKSMTKKEGTKLDEEKKTQIRWNSLNTELQS